MYIVAIQLSARAARTGWMGTVTLRFAGYANKVMNTSEFNIYNIKKLPRQKLQATTFGPELAACRLLFPGTVAARFLCAACNSDAGRMGGSVGADIGAGVGGEGSFNGSVAICGTSLSGK